VHVPFVKEKKNLITLVGKFQLNSRFILVSIAS